MGRNLIFFSYLRTKVQGLAHLPITFIIFFNHLLALIKVILALWSYVALHTAMGVNQDFLSN